MVDEQCAAQIWKKDTYRYTGRGKSGFSMHYNRDRCSRRAVVDGLCRQHSRMPGIMLYRGLSIVKPQREERD